MPRLIKDGWLREYLRYSEGQEAPEVFHLWVGLSVLSAAMGRQVVLDRGFYQLYPNLYVILVAGSAVCRKSVAIAMGKRFMNSLDRGIHTISDKVTPEKLLVDLAENGEEVRSDGSISVSAQGAIVADELSVFLSQQSVNAGMIPLLTKLYDCQEFPFRYGTKGQGTLEVKDPCVTILAGSNPRFLKLAIPPDHVGGGFLSRTVFVYHNKPKKPIPWPKLSEDERMMSYRLISDLNHISKLEGEFKPSREAFDWYGDWYAEEIDRISGYDELDGEILARSPDVLLKVAMLLSLSESDDLVIQLDHMQAAHAIIRDAQEHYPEALSSLMADTPTTSAIDKVLEKIRKEGKITYRSLLRKCWRFAPAAVMAEALETLEEGGLIRTRREGRSRWVEFVGTGDSSKSEVTGEGVSQ